MYKTEQGTPCEPPRTTTERMQHGRNTSSPPVKKTLLFHNVLMKEFIEGKVQNHYTDLVQSQRTFSWQGRFLKNTGC